MENKRELVIVEQKTLADTEAIIESNKSKIMAKDGSSVFPIKETMRKKLEKLKEESLGDIKSQLKFIKDEKYQQFIQFNKSKGEKLKADIEKKTASLRKTAAKIMERKREEDEKLARKYHEAGKDFYQKVDEIHKLHPDVLTQFEGYDFPLKKFKDYKPKQQWELEKQKADDKQSFNISLDENKFNKAIVEKEWRDKYAGGFDIAKTKIDELEKQFNEALLFGDMNVVKSVYYNLRAAEQFLTNLQKMNFK